MNTSTRVVADCRQHPGSNCSLTIAGTEAEVLDAAIQHATSKHGMKATPDLRNQIRSSLKEEALAHA